MEIIKTKDDLENFAKEIWEKYWLDNYNLKANYQKLKFKFTENDKLIGYMSIGIEHGLFWIKEIILKDEFRGGKRGHQIMDFTIDLAKKNSCHKMRLETSKEFMPNAYHLYKKYGFEDETMLKNDWCKKDWIIMSKFI